MTNNEKFYETFGVHMNPGSSLCDLCDGTKPCKECPLYGHGDDYNQYVEPREVLGYDSKLKIESLNNSANIMMYAMKGDSMLDIARKVVDAVEFSVKEPSGYHLLSFDKDRETKNRIKELIEYLKVYTNWRD